MKPKFENEKDAYTSCVSDGFIKEVFKINKERVKALLKNSKIASDSADSFAKTLKEEDEKWQTVYTLSYDALRMDVEALLLLDKLISLNHQCIFAVLCVKHPELEFDWNFFEKVRRKRNGINYYGEKVTYDDWKSIENQIKLCISTLKKEVEKSLDNLEK